MVENLGSLNFQILNQNRFPSKGALQLYYGYGFITLMLLKVEYKAVTLMKYTN